MLIKNKDVRTIDARFKVRDASNPDDKTISGYAVVFNQPSEDLGGFIEYVDPHAFEGVDLSNVLLLFNHDFNNTLARVTANNLSLTVDDTGLRFEATLPNTQLGNDTYTNILNGNYQGCSFGFTISGDDWSEDDQGTPIHTIYRIDELFEISICPLPAYTETSVNVERSLEKLKNKKRDVGATGNSADSDTLNALLSQVQNLTEQITTLQENENSNENNNGNDDQMTDNEQPQFNVGDVVILSADHMPGMQGAIAKVDSVNDGAYEVDYWPTDGSAEVKNHKWVTADEMQATDKPYPASNPLADDASDSSSEDAADTEDARDDGDGQLQDSLDKHLKGESRNKMKNVTPKVNLKNKEVRGFLNFMKSKGQIRDGVTTAELGAVIPKQILDLVDQPNDPTNLAQYVNQSRVTSPKGDLPVLQKNVARLVSKAELANNPDLADFGIKEVDYNLETLAGVLPVSYETISDAAVDIPSIVAQYVSDARALTEQEKIGSVLQKATAVSAATADDLKDAFNKGLSNYTKMIVVSESAYAEIDKLKDGNGRYLFQDSISAASGKTLFGAPVIPVPDTVLGKVGENHLFIGDLNAFVLEAFKDDIEVKWTDNDLWGDKASVYLRADFQVADDAAGKFVTFTPATGTTTTTSGK